MRKGDPIRYNGREGKVVGTQPNGMVDFVLDGEDFVQRTSPGNLGMARKNSSRPPRKERKRRTSKTRRAQRNPTPADELRKEREREEGKGQVDPGDLQAAAHRMGVPVVRLEQALRARSATSPLDFATLLQKVEKAFETAVRDDEGRAAKGKKGGFLQGFYRQLERDAERAGRLFGEKSEPTPAPPLFVPATLEKGAAKERYSRWEDIPEYLQPFVVIYGFPKEAASLGYEGLTAQEKRDAIAEAGRRFQLDQRRHVVPEKRAPVPGDTRPTVSPKIEPTIKREMTWQERRELAAQEKARYEAARSKALEEKQAPRQEAMLFDFQGLPFLDALAAAGLKGAHAGLNVIMAKAGLTQSSFYGLSIPEAVALVRPYIIGGVAEDVGESTRQREERLRGERRRVTSQRKQQEGRDAHKKLLQGQSIGDVLKKENAVFFTRADPPRLSSSRKTYCGNAVDGTAYYMVVSTKTRAIGRWLREDDLLPAEDVEAGQLKRGLSHEEFAMEVNRLETEGDAYGQVWRVIPVPVGSIDQFSKIRKTYENTEFGARKYTSSFSQRQFRSSPVAPYSLQRLKSTISDAVMEAREGKRQTGDLTDADIKAYRSLLPEWEKASDTGYGGLTALKAPVIRMDLPYGKRGSETVSTKQELCFYWLSGKASSSIDRLKEQYQPYAKQVYRVPYTKEKTRQQMGLVTALQKVAGYSEDMAKKLVQGGCVAVRKPGFQIERDEETGEEAFALTRDGNKRRYAPTIVTNEKRKVFTNDEITLIFGDKSYDPNFSWVSSKAPIEEDVRRLLCRDPEDITLAKVLNRSSRAFKRYFSQMEGFRRRAFEFSTSPGQLMHSARGRMSHGLPRLLLRGMAQSASVVGGWITRIETLRDEELAARKEKKDPTLTDLNLDVLRGIIDAPSRPGDAATMWEQAYTVYFKATEAGLVEENKAKTGYQPTFSPENLPDSVRSYAAAQSGVFRPQIMQLHEGLTGDPFAGLFTAKYFTKGVIMVNKPWDGYELGPWRDYAYYIHDPDEEAYERIQTYHNFLIRAATALADRFGYIELLDQVYSMVAAMDVYRAQYLFLLRTQTFETKQSKYAVRRPGKLGQFFEEAPQSVRGKYKANSAAAAARAGQFASDLVLAYWFYYFLGGYNSLGPLNAGLEDRYIQQKIEEADKVAAESGKKLTYRQQEEAAKPDWEIALKRFQAEIDLLEPETTLASVGGLSIYVTYNPLLFQTTRLYWRSSRERSASWQGFKRVPKLWLSLDDAGRYGAGLAFIQAMVLTSENAEKFVKRVTARIKPQAEILSQVVESTTRGSGTLNRIRKDRKGRFREINLFWPLGKTPAEALREVQKYEENPLDLLKTAKVSFETAVSTAAALSAHGLPVKGMAEGRGSQAIMGVMGRREGGAPVPATVSWEKKESLKTRLELVNEAGAARQAATDRLTGALSKILDRTIDRRVRAEVLDALHEYQRTRKDAYGKPAPLPLTDHYDPATVRRIYEDVKQLEKPTARPVGRFKEAVRSGFPEHAIGRTLDQEGMRVGSQLSKIQRVRRDVEAKLVELRRRINA